MLKWLGLSLLIILLDQYSKTVISHTMLLYQSIAIFPHFSLTYVQNTGAAFSFLSEAGGWQRWFFAILTTAISIWLVVWIYRLKHNQTLLAIALSLLLGGAIGNLIDRLIFGYVIDFIDIYYKNWHWPVFNVADMSISLGVFLILLEGFGVGSGAEGDNDLNNPKNTQ